MNKNKQSKALLLKKLYENYKECSPCPLKINAMHKIVCGQGNPDAQLMLIGEAPGKHEEEQGLPFVGKSGILLTKTLALLGIDRQDIFITNCVKCRPPHNRKPTHQEVKAYKKILLKEIAIIHPKVICTLGATALECLLDAPAMMKEMHGKELSFNGIILIPTYHPAYILRSQKSIFSAWLKDLQKAWSLC